MTTDESQLINPDRHGGFGEKKLIQRKGAYE